MQEVSDTNGLASWRKKLEMKVPGTFAYRQVVDKLAESILIQQIDRFDGLRHLDEATKARLGGAVQRHAARLANWSAVLLWSRLIVVNFIDSYLILLYLLIFLLAPFFTTLWLAISFPLVIWFVFFWLYIPLAIVSMVPLKLLSTVRRGFNLSENYIVLTWFALTLAYSLLITLKGRQAATGEAGILGFGFGQEAALWIVRAIYFSMLLYAFPNYLRDLRKYKANGEKLSFLISLASLLFGGITFLLIGLFALGDSSLRAVQVLNMALLAGLAGGLGVGLLIILNFLFLIIPSLVYQHRLSRFPDSLLVRSLTDLLAETEAAPEKWDEFHFKQSLIASLETAASAIENFSRHLSSGEVATDQWLEEITRKKAAALRGLKTWVLMPNPNTREDFMQQLACSLVAAASGAWDDLPIEMPKEVKRTRRVRVLLAANLVNLRVLISGFLPLAALLWLQRSPLALEGMPYQYLLGGAFIWAALTVLRLLNPQFSQTLQDIKEVRGLTILGEG